MAQKTYIARKGEDADFAALTVDTLTVGGAAVSGGDVTLADDQKILFGSSSDVTLEWDTAATPDQLQLACVADDTVFAIGIPGATQKSFDVRWYGNEANGASSLTADASANLLYTTGVDVQVKDDDFIVFGSGAGATGDVTIEWDTTGTDALRMVATGAAEAFEIGAASHLLNVTITGALTVGVDGTGHDVTLFGDTPGSKAVWAQAGDALEFTAAKLTLFDNSVLGFGNTTAAPDVSIKWDASNLVMATAAASAGWLIGAAANVINATLTGTLTVGVDDTGYDVKAFGATTGCSLLWDESEDQLVITGPADVPALKIAGAGSKSAAAYAAAGSAWADGDTPALAADQMYLKIDVGGTVYRIPLWADA